MTEARKQFDREFLAPARRAFARVAKKLRAENARLGLPLVVGVGNRVVYVPITPARKLAQKKSRPASATKTSQP